MQVIRDAAIRAPFPYHEPHTCTMCQAIFYLEPGDPFEWIIPDAVVKVACPCCTTEQTLGSVFTGANWITPTSQTAPRWITPSYPTQLPAPFYQSGTVTVPINSIVTWDSGTNFQSSTNFQGNLSTNSTPPFSIGD